MNSLSARHKHVLLTGFQDIHRRMADLEATMTQSVQTSSFSEYVVDLSPAEAQVVRDYFSRVRSTMLARLEANGVPLEVRRTSLRSALQSGLAFLAVAVDELGPTRLRGYGAIDASGEETLLEVQRELSRIFDRLGAYLREGSA